MLSGAMNSPPSLQAATKAKSSSSCQQLGSQRGARSASPLAGGDAFRQAISASRLSTSKRMRIRGCGRTGFQLGRLVDHVLGRGDLAAVVQPGRDVHGFPVFIGRAEVR
jgi:hypothetical protein